MERLPCPFHLVVNGGPVHLHSVRRAVRSDQPSFPWLAREYATLLVATGRPAGERLAPMKETGRSGGAATRSAVARTNHVKQEEQLAQPIVSVSITKVSAQLPLASCREDVDAQAARGAQASPLSAIR